MKSAIKHLNESKSSDCALIFNHCTPLMSTSTLIGAVVRDISPDVYNNLSFSSYMEIIPEVFELSSATAMVPVNLE